MDNSNYRELCGCIHLHTTFSDGGVNYPDLISAAQKAGLDFVAVTDHMTLKGREAGFQGLHDGLLVLVGYEHNDKDNRNHYLAFGTSQVMKGVTEPQEYINRIKAEGGIGFLAHPAEKRNYFGKLPPYPWTKWDAEGFDGIELWNQMSDWIEQLKNLRSFVRIFYPRRFMGNVPEELLEKWDRLNRTRFVSGIGGVDAHTRKIHLGPLFYTVFPIKVELKGVRTHIYTKKTDLKDQIYSNMVLEHLKNGHGFISNYRHGDARGSRFFMVDSENNIIAPGAVNKETTPPLTFQVSLPLKAEIRLFRNGKLERTNSGKHCEFPIRQRGIYRIQVHRGKNAWIYSNPFPVGTYPFND
ncbi:MAG: PHP domain-containing protein [Chitinispirillaceae bacterium]